MARSRIDIGSIRREQVVEAAAAIIAEHGIQNLSLSAIEKRAGMSRGHLTYYFPTKEDILLAVFDHMVETMRKRVGVGECEEFERSGWAGTQCLLQMILLAPPVNPTFAPLQYTFLAQMSHREDFRERVAGLYEEWRTHMARALEKDLTRVESPPPFPPRALATFIQAVLHGMAMQRAANPEAFDREQILALCLDVLGSYLGLRSPRSRANGGTPAEESSPNRKRKPPRTSGSQS
jgi:AcrR family transcriptional regulator